jgi:PKD repeat protein
MGAVASINAPTDANPNFIGDTPGAYVVTLTVIANGVSHTTTAPIVLGA